MTDEKVEVKAKETYVLKEVVTQTDTAIGKSDSEEVFSEKGLLVEILNKLDRIEVAIMQ
jgi:hypothetical protein